MCALLYENRLGIMKIVISFVYVFCPNTGTKFGEPYHSNHVIPHRVIVRDNFFTILYRKKIADFSNLDFSKKFKFSTRLIGPDQRNSY